MLCAPEIPRPRFAGCLDLRDERRRRVSLTTSVAETIGRSAIDRIQSVHKCGIAVSVGLARRVQSSLFLR